MKKTTLLKSMLLLCALVVGSGSAWADTVSFIFTGDKPNCTGVSGTVSGITYETGKTGSATATAYNSTNGLVLYGVSSGGGYFNTTAATSGSITNISVTTNNKKNSPKYTVYGSTDGSNWTQIGSQTNGGSTASFDTSDDYTYVKIANTTAATAQLGINSIIITYTAASNYINVSPTTKNMTIAGGDATFTISTDQTLDANPTQFYTTSGGTVTTDKPAWITSASYATGTLTLSVAANTGAARTAYFKVEKESVKSGVITISQDAFISVTSVSLNKTSLSMKVGDNETLTPTIEPAEASNKAVTWESDDESVATVSAVGVVTAVGIGTCTITVTTEDGSFTDNCDVTVDPAPAVTLDFTNSGWDFPDDYTTTAQTYTNGGFTISMGASDGHKKMVQSTVTKGIIFGKEDATLSLPAFSFNVSKIKVYGISNASGKVTFNVFVGSDAVSTGVTGSATDHEFAIDAAKQAAGNIYTIKVTNANNCQISKIEIFGYQTVTIGANGYTTFASSSSMDLTDANRPTGLKAYKATRTGANISFSPLNQTVAAETGLLLLGETKGGTYNIPVVASGTAVSENALVGVTSATAKQSDPSGNYYFVMKKATTADSPLQFLPLSTTSAVTIPAGKAYIEVPNGDLTSSHELTFTFEDATEGDVTGIAEVSNKKAFTGEFYNLNGQKVSQPTKGLYIMNGKKVIVK